MPIGNDSGSPAKQYADRIKKMKDEDHKKIEQIEEQWQNEEMWQEKEDVFDFMRKHFEFLLKKAKGE